MGKPAPTSDEALRIDDAGADDAMQAVLRVKLVTLTIPGTLAESMHTLVPSPPPRAHLISLTPSPVLFPPLELRENPLAGRGTHG